VFALPLTDGSFLLGVLIRRDRRTARVGFLPDEVRNLPSSTPTIARSDLGILTSVTTDNLDGGVWPVLGILEPFDPAEWPEPPSFAGDTASTPAALAESLDRYIRARRKRAMVDATFLAKHPQLADPAVGASYLHLRTEEPLSFLRTSLRLWGTLSRLVLERVDLSEGVVISTLPAEVGAEFAADEPQWGGKLSRRGRRLIRGHHVFPDGRREPVYDDRLSVQTMISEWLGSGANHLCVFGLPNAAPRVLPAWAPGLESTGGRLVTFQEECYLLLPRTAAEDADALSKAILWAHTSWHTISFLTSLERAVRLPLTLSNVTIELLGMLIDSLEAILVGAYDGEGYVVWTKTNGDKWLIG
jgi:hypothetical protein